MTDYNVNKHPFGADYIVLHRRVMKGQVGVAYHAAIDLGVCDFLGNVDYLKPDMIIKAIKDSEIK